MTTATPLTWLITGASRGLGRAIAEAALHGGDTVVAAVRRPEAVADLAARFGKRLHVIVFDAADVAAVPGAVAAAVGHVGRIDALVNNAGRGYVGAAEEITDSQLAESISLHLLVPAALTRAVLPGMRAHGRGAIVQMSSQGGRMAFPGVGTYCAGKFALEGYSEALAGEVAPHGIAVMIVEPSRFRTGFNAPDVLAVADSSDAYRDVLGTVRADLTGAHGVQEGDPDRAAAIIVGLVRSGEMPLRLPLGAEAIERIGASYRQGLADLDTWAPIARSADFDDVGPAAARPI